MLVVDASVVAVALGDDGMHGARARQRLRGKLLFAPDLIDLEVLSVLRSGVATSALTARRGEEALADLIDLPIRRALHRPLLRRCWELRQNLTCYDASYVALAETLNVRLVTADARLAHAPGLRCEVELLD